MYYGFYYDWTYILVLIGVVLSLLAIIPGERNICKIFENPQLFRDDRTRSGRTDSQKKWNL